MEDLIKINSVINICLNYKAIRITKDDKVMINDNNIFNIAQVNEKGKFIGEKYKKFLLFFKTYTYEYQNYIWALTEEPATMSFRKGNTTYLSAYIEDTIKSAMELELYKKDAEKLMKNFKLAGDNLKTQYKILDDLKKINNIKY